MQFFQKPRILGRFILLSGLGVLGAVSFLPSVTASANPRPPMAQLSLFAFTFPAICIASSWFGLRLADAVCLPMPYLPRLDRQSEPKRRNGFLRAIAFGILFAICAIYILHFIHQPNLGGSFWSRIASVFFAARGLARGRIWIGILVAAIFFVAFHFAGLAGQSVALITVSIALNRVFGLGFLYARYGFESLLLCHAVGHILAVTLA